MMKVLLVSVLVVVCGFEAISAFLTCDQETIEFGCGEKGIALKKKVAEAMGEECLKKGAPLKEKDEKVCTDYKADKDVKKACAAHDSMKKEAMDLMGKECLVKGMKAAMKCSADTLGMMCSEKGVEIAKKMVEKLGEDCAKKGEPLKPKYEALCTTYKSDKDTDKACKTSDALNEEWTKLVGEECANKMWGA